jgi:hypothetical protein
MYETCLKVALKPEMYVTGDGYIFGTCSQSVGKGSQEMSCKKASLGLAHFMYFKNVNVCQIFL